MYLCHPADTRLRSELKCTKLHGRDVAGGTAGLEEDDDDDEEAGPGSRAQYVSANCVVFTHYSGDVASVVDEHFSRALSYTENKSNSSAASQVKGKSVLHRASLAQKPSYVSSFAMVTNKYEVSRLIVVQSLVTVLSWCMPDHVTA
jgi:hypothetical protein